MASVTERFAGWLDFVRDLAEEPPSSFPREAVADRIEESFGSLVAWNWMEPDGRFGTVFRQPPAGFPVAEEIAVWERGAHRAHPLICWYRHTGDPRAMSLGRVPRAIVPPGGAELFRDLLRPHGLDQQLSIPYRTGERGDRTFLLAQTGADYAAEDLELARRIQPLLFLLDSLVAAGPDPATAVRQRGLGLTARESVVLQLLSEGRTAAAIARRLAISPRTVHTHLRNIYRKLEVRDRLGAVLAAKRLGLLSGKASAEDLPDQWGVVTAGAVLPWQEH